MAYVRTISLVALAAILVAGCGSRDLDINYENPSVYDTIQFVNAGVTLAREEGKNAALCEFMAYKTPFKQGQLYIFAVDFNGKVLAHGYQRELVSKNIKDLLGLAIAEEMIKKAALGNGWLTYRWRNPVTGKEETKQAYVANVDNRWFIGTGVYLGEAEAK